MPALFAVILMITNNYIIIFSFVDSIVARIIVDITTTDS